MKVKAYIRVAHGKNTRNSRSAVTKVAVTQKPTNDALTYVDSRLGRHVTMPTVAFAVEFDIPDAMFKRAEQVIATMTIPEESATVAAVVKAVEPSPSSEVSQ